ncbi:MAG: hypothetical protein GY847_00755 [Proteobacteria bacterium]|nr:hypothetical protein [Pseudomonadota bacterium]
MGTQSGNGHFYLGGQDNARFDPSTEIRLEPDKSGMIKYFWGTRLYSASLGNTSLPQLTDSRFYVDTGSSLFKGDRNFLVPILQTLKAYKVGNIPIFDKIFDEDGTWVGLSYANSRVPVT